MPRPITRPRKNRLLRPAAAGLVVVAVIAGGGWVLAWKPAPTLDPPAGVSLSGTFRPYHEHDEARQGDPGPYVFRLKHPSSGGDVVVFGSIHSNRPDEPQMEQIRSAWDSASPTLALTETTLGLHWGGRDSAIRRLSEFGLLAWLARKDNVPIVSLEPSWDTEITSVLERFSKQEAAAFYFLRVYISEREGTGSEHRETLAAHLLRKRTGRPGLEGSFADLAAFDQWWDTGPREILGPWRTLPAEAVWPREEGPVLTRIAFEANRARDRHFALLIVDAVNRGEQVFVVCGASHALTLEPVLRASIER